MLSLSLMPDEVVVSILEAANRVWVKGLEGLGEFSALKALNN